MKINLPTTIEETISHLLILAPVNYGEEDIPNDFPGRTGDLWRALVEIETGRIIDWPAGKAVKMFMTVKDSGTYQLIGENLRVIASRTQDYVPHCLVPGNYGDTIEMTIDGNGVIKEWPHKPDITEVIEAFFPRGED
jgi:hypothetical protein